MEYAIALTFAIVKFNIKRSVYCCLITRQELKMFTIFFLIK